MAIELSWLRFFRQDGSTLFQETSDYRFSSWTKLYRALLSHFDPAHYHFGRELASIAPDEKGAQLSLVNGASIQVDPLRLRRRYLLAVT